MSEYQYYEFQALDRPLSSEQQAAMRKLSSRVALSSTRAIFNYSYGDFRGEPLQVLEQHFDVLLYIANWGSKQLAFRFPAGALDPAQLQPYLLGEEEGYVGTLHTTPQYLILNMEINEHEGYGWIEGEGLLDPLIPLREAQLWARIPALLAKRSASGYDEGVALLADLRDLAVHRGQRVAFDARLAEVMAPSTGSSALQRRLKDQRLV